MNLTILNPSSLPENIRRVFEILVSRVNSVFKVEHNNATGAHTAITATSLATTGAISAGTTVTATTGVLERGRSVAMGIWTTVTYAAGNFTASAGTWTVDAADQTTFKYMLIGKTLFVNFVIANTDVSDAGVSLRITLPGGFTAAHRIRTPIRIVDAGVAAIAYALVTEGTTYIECFATAAGGGFGITAADDTNVAGCLAIEVV